MRFDPVNVCCILSVIYAHLKRVRKCQRDRTLPIIRLSFYGLTQYSCTMTRMNRWLCTRLSIYASVCRNMRFPIMMRNCDTILSDCRWPFLNIPRESVALMFAARLFAGGSRHTKFQLSLCHFLNWIAIGWEWRWFCNRLWFCGHDDHQMPLWNWTAKRKFQGNDICLAIYVNTTPQPS